MAGDIELRTRVEAAPMVRPIALGDQILSMGSCFAEHIAARLEARGFRIVSNPFGILYNPESVARGLRRLCAGEPYSADDLMQDRGRWLSLDHHGAYEDRDRDGLLDRINADFDRGCRALEQCDVLLITFGTAYGWFLRHRPDRIVANCHRLSADRFERRLIPSSCIAASWRTLIVDLRRRRPNLRVILTVSPVRHLRNQPTENTLSKAHLVVADHEIADALEEIHLFPAYEILLDELRDYRFYAQDMVHPSELAQDIIWGRFVKSCLNERAQHYCDRIDPLLEAARHRPSDPGSQATRSFAQKYLRRIDDLRREFPEAGLDRLAEHFGGMASS